MSPVRSSYAPGKVPHGHQARPRWPWAADSPPHGRSWTWVARGSMGRGSLQSTAVQGAIGWPKSACRDTPRPDQQPHATAPASGWPGPTPVRRARRIELARRRGTALQDHAAGSAMQHHGLAFRSRRVTQVGGLMNVSLGRRPRAEGPAPAEGRSSGPKARLYGVTNLRSGGAFSIEN